MEEEKGLEAGQASIEVEEVTTLCDCISDPASGLGIGGQRLLRDHLLQEVFCNSSAQVR